MEKSFRENNTEADFALVLWVGSIKFLNSLFCAILKKGHLINIFIWRKQKEEQGGEKNKLKTKIVFHILCCRSWTSLSITRVFGYPQPFFPHSCSLSFASQFGVKNIINIMESRGRKHIQGQFLLTFSFFISL